MTTIETTPTASAATIADTAESKVLKVGGNEWIKDKFHRIYLPNDQFADWLGLVVNLYKTGHVSSATLEGEEISNSKASALLAQIRSLKIWWDVPTQKWNSKGDEELAEKLTGIAKQKIAQL